MEYFTKIMKKTGWGSLLTSIIFAILGIVLIVNPQGTLKVVAYVFGAIFMLIGIYKIISYFVAKGKYDFFNYDLAFGIIAIIIGLATIVYMKQIGTVLRVIIGIWIIYSAIIRINLSAKLKMVDSRMWASCLILAILMLIAGLYILFTPNTILVTIGIVILIYSILDIMESIIFLVNIKNITE